MERKELLTKILAEYGCSTALQIVGIANRQYNEKLTPSQVSGSMRSMITHGEAASGKDVKGTTAYWLTDEYKAKIKEESGLVSMTMKVAYCNKPNKNKTIITKEWEV